jgi:nucleoside-diphosphate-sugar epimerase
VVLAEDSEPSKVTNVLITGGSGFFGRILKQRLLTEGLRVINLDLVADVDRHSTLTSVQGDIRDVALVESLFAEHRFHTVFHCAAMLAHERIDPHMLWSSNVDGTRNLAEACRRHKVKTLIFTSTNCLWARGAGRAVREDDPPAPAEPYGQAKLAAEQVLKEYEDDLAVIILRCPTIVDEGRLGLLAILFEFIADGRTVWIVGNGGNRYQFIYAQDLATACMQSMDSARSSVFHVGSDDVPTLREVYEALIRDSGSRSRVRSLPRGPAIAAMKLAHGLRVSPLGPYHYRMIAESFIFDTTRIRQQLGWQPTLTNRQMIVKAYRYYIAHRGEIDSRAGEVSAHSRPAAMGIIRLLKWLS